MRGMYVTPDGRIIIFGGEVIGGTRLIDTVPFVDLDIAFSPVMPMPAGMETYRFQMAPDGQVDPESLKIDPVNYRQVTPPCQAIRRLDGNYYLLREGRDFRDRPWRSLDCVTAEDLKPMRARYILWKNYFYRLLGELEPGGMLLPNGFHQWVMRSFFPDGVYVIPLVLLNQMAETGVRQRPGDVHD